MLSGTETVPFYFEEIVEECPSLKRELDERGEGSSYQKWWLSLKLLAYCEDGEDFVHTISDGHRDYTQQAVERKWQQLLQEKESGTMRGATTCETMAASCTECQSCPHWGDPTRGVDWKSPIIFGKKSDPDEYPYPYVKTKYGVSMHTYDLEGNPTIVEVINLDILRMELLVGQKGDRHVLLEILHKKQVRHVVFPTGIIGDMASTKLSTAFAEAGFVLHAGESKALRPFIVSWYKQIDAAKRTSSVALESYGWVDTASGKAFAVGDVVYFPDGTTKVTAPPDKMLSAYYRQRGSEARWRQLIEWALEARHTETEVILASSFAAPLVPFTGVSGCLMSAVSKESGTGKTLALRLAQSVWGDPVKAPHSMNDTVNAVTKKLAITNNLPNYWDELRIRGSDGQRFVDFLFQLGQGRDKQRMQQTTELHAAKSWCTLLVCTSNQNIREHIEALDHHTDAGSLRILEFEVSPLNGELMHNPLAFGDITDNYGHIGPQYAAWLAENRETVQQLADGMTERLMKKYNAVANERFLVATLASLLLGASLAKRLGYVNFDLPTMNAFLDKCYSDAVADIKEQRTSTDSTTSALGIVRQFMLENAKRTCVTSVLKGSDLMFESRNVERPMTVRVITGPEPRDKQIMFHTSTFKAWVYEYGGNYGSILSELKAMGCIVGSARFATGLTTNDVGASNMNAQTIRIIYNTKTEDLFPE